MEGDTVRLMRAVREGDRGAFDLLFARIYDELRAAARRRLRAHGAEATLNTTGLVHEAYLRLVDPEVVGPEDRDHFLALASRAMRFVLIDQARARRAQRRGGGRAAVTLDETVLAREEQGASTQDVDLLAVDRALELLSERSPRQAELVEYRFFGGLTYEEISGMTGRSLRTVKRDWTRARTWLYTFMKAEREGHLGAHSSGEGGTVGPSGT
jgi:RNA polymerase sigma factor (TIGR02999 family)